MMKSVAVINLLEWDVSYTELATWAANTGSAVFGVYSTEKNSRYKYIFENEEDFIAFKLAFSKSRDMGIVAGYSPTGTPPSKYYCPYIPIINEKDYN